MKRSDDPRNTIARKPSHFGSYMRPSPVGSRSASFASIGSIGGSIGNVDTSDHTPLFFSGTARPKRASKCFIRLMLPSTFSDLDLQGVPSHDRKRLALLAEVSESIASHRDLNALFRDLAQRLPRVVPFDYINLVLHDPSRNAMRLRLLVAPPEATIQAGEEFPVDDSPGGFVWKTQEPL